MVHAVDLMSYNSDKDRSAELWYRLLNCGLKLSACVGTDALLDRSTDPLGGDRVYVKTSGPLTMQSWLDGLKGGRSFVTNGPIPTLEVNGKGPGETCELATAGKVRVAATVESYVPVDTLEVIVNGKVASRGKSPRAIGRGCGSNASRWSCRSNEVVGSPYVCVAPMIRAPSTGLPGPTRVRSSSRSLARR